MDERKLIRSVATAACVVALVTVPIVRISLGNHESWIAGAQFFVLGSALLGLGYRRVSLSAVFGTTALLLWGVTAASFWQSTGVLVAGGEVVGYGSGPLWIATALGPLIFLSFPMRRAVQFMLAAVSGYVLLFVLRTGGAAGDVLLSSGLWFQALATVLVVITTLVVALSAQRSAEEWARAEQLRRHAAQERHELTSAQHRRRVVFTRTAADLRGPMAQLTDAVSELEGAVLGDVRRRAEHVASLSTAVLDEIVVSLRTLAASAHAAVSQDQPSSEEDVGDTSDGASPRHGRTGVAIIAAVVLVVVLDAVHLGGLVQVAAPDAEVLAAAGTRMVLVLFLGAAIVAVRRPGRLGWSTIVATVLVHPVAVLGSATADATPVIVQTLVPAWRNAVLSTTFILLLSAIIDRRVRARDAAQQEAARELESSRELRLEESAAERTYAEAAHELKNPLTVITAGARMLWNGPAQSEQQMTQLRDAVVRSTARLDDRLREMRAVAGIPQDDALLPTPITLEVCSALKAAATELAAELQVELDLECDGGQVVIVPSHLDQVMENLLGNAQAYGEPGGPVRIAARIIDGHVHVEVANRGGRLTARQAGQVFEPYWRATGGDDHPAGSGLGLAIVARLVGGWRGSCWCSVSGGWTRVGFGIPLVGSEATAGPRTPTPRHGPARLNQRHPRGRRNSAVE